jgi:hypothetical protein
VENPETLTPDALGLQLLAALKHPDTFQMLVDSLPPGPTRFALRLWGVLHGVYTWSEQAIRDGHDDRAAADRAT